MNLFTVSIALLVPLAPLTACLPPLEAFLEPRQWHHYAQAYTSASVQASSTQAQATQTASPLGVQPSPVLAATPSGTGGVTAATQQSTSQNTTGQASGSCPNVSGSGNIYTNDYNSLPATGSDGVCGLPYGSLVRDHIVSLTGNVNGGPNCGVCLQVCGVTCNYFLVADGKPGDGLDVDWSGAGEATVGATTGHATGTWKSVDQSFCKGFWNGQSDNNPPYGCLAGLQ